MDMGPLDRLSELVDEALMMVTKAAAAYPKTAVHPSAIVPTAATTAGRRTQRRTAHGNRHRG
jgi:hypothetical protein